MAKPEEVLVARQQVESAAVLRRRGSPLGEALRDIGLRVGSIVVLLGAWWLLSLVFPPALIPRPVETLSEVAAIIRGGEFLTEMGNTLRRVLVGFGIAMVISIPLGIVMGTFRSLESFFEPPVILGLTMPGLIWAVLMIMFFGLTETSAYGAVAVTIFPMLTISIWQGTKAMDKDLMDMSSAFHASPWSKVVDVILPQLVSHILAAIRYGLGLAWKVVVLSEVFGLSNGIGFMINQAFGLFRMEGVLAWTLAFTLVMICIEFGIVKLVERRVTRWRPAVSVW